MSQATIKFSQFLHKTIPPQLIIHVGVGLGVGPMHQWREWDVAHAWLIEADGSKLEWATPLLAEKPNWQACACTIAQKDGQAEFYSASNPTESALYAAEKLRPLWPGLTTLEHEVRATQCLDSLVTLPDPAIDQGWLIIDCLPALDILQGASTTLNHCSVVWLRVLLQTVAGMEAGSTLAEITTFLQTYGFDCVNVAESNHPAMGDAIFIRRWSDWLRPQIHALTRENAELTAEKASKAEQQQLLITELTALSDTRTRQTRQIEQQNSQIEALNQEKSKLSAAMATQAKEKVLLEQSLILANEQANAEVNAQISDYIAKLDEQSKEIARQQAVLQEKTLAVSAANAAHAALETERDTLATQHAQLSKELAQVMAQLKANQTQQLASTAQNQKAMDALQEEKTRLAASLELLLPELTTLKQNQDNLSDEVRQLKSVRAQQVDLLARQQQQLDEINQEKARLLAQHALLEQEADAFKLKKSELENALASLTEQNTRITRQLSTLQSTQSEQNQQHLELINQHQQRIEALTNEKADMLAQYATLEQEVKAVNLKKEQLETQFPSVIAQKDRFKQENDALANTQHVLQQEKIALLKQKDELVHQVEALTIALQDKTTVAKQQQDSIQAGERAHAEQVETLNQALTHHLSVLEEKKDGFNQLLQEISTLTAQQSEYQTQIATLHAVQLEQSAVNSAQEQQIAQLSQAKSKLDATVLKLERSLSDKELELAKMEAELEQTRQRQRQLSEEMVRAEAQIDLIKNVFLREVSL